MAERFRLRFRLHHLLMAMAAVALTFIVPRAHDWFLWRVAEEPARQALAEAIANDDPSGVYIREHGKTSFKITKRPGDLTVFQLVVDEGHRKLSSTVSGSDYRYVLSDWKSAYLQIHGWKWW